MTVNEVSQVYGFTIKNAELLKLLLAQMEKNPKFVGDYETYDSADTEAVSEAAKIVARGGKPDEKLLTEVAKIAEWTHDGKLYEFHELSHFFRQGPKDKKGLGKARALFPELPESVRMFHNAMHHDNTWHLGIEISYMKTGWADKRPKVKPMDPVALVEKHGDTLRALQTRYRRILKEGRPVIFEITDDCACCS